MVRKSKDSRPVVVPLHPLKANKASEQKWGREVLGLGFCIIPSLLLRAQARLKLDAKKLAILMHLADFWWEADRKPYPSKKTLGERINLSARQVQRHIAEMEQMGLLQRVERKAPGRGKLSNYYDLAGLVARLKELESEFRGVEEEAKEARRRVAKPGLRRRTAAAVE